MKTPIDLSDKRWLIFTLVGLLVGITIHLASSYRLETPMIVDTIGYAQASHQLARAEGLAYIDPHNRVGHSYYTLHSFKVVREGSPHLYYSYPPGLPVLAAAVERILNAPESIYLVPPIAAGLLVAVTFALGTLLFEAWVGVLGSAILLSIPVFLSNASSFWAEVPGAAFLYLGLLLFLISLRYSLPRLPAIALTILGGLITGAAFFVRFSNVSVLPGLALIIWLEGKKQSEMQRWTLWFVSSASLVLICLFAFNNWYYGGPLTTGYSPLHGWYAEPAFSLRYAFGESFVNGYSAIAMTRELIKDFGLLLLFLAPAVAMRPDRTTLGVTGIFLSVALPYTVYAFAPEGNNARFLIPAFVPLCLLIGHGIVKTQNLIPSNAFRWFLLFVLALFLILRLPPILEDLENRNEHARYVLGKVDRIVAATEPEAVLLAYSLNDTLAVYGERSVLNYRHMPTYDEEIEAYDPTSFEELFTEEIDYLLRQGIPVYYLRDRDPSLFDSWEILNRHYLLELVLENEALFQITDD